MRSDTAPTGGSHQAGRYGAITLHLADQPHQVLVVSQRAATVLIAVGAYTMRLSSVSVVAVRAVKRFSSETARPILLLFP